MKKRIKKLWLAALRSGEYRQGTGALRSQRYMSGKHIKDVEYVDVFCCLGVLCNLHAQAHPEIAAAQTNRSAYMGLTGTLPHEVADWAGIPRRTEDDENSAQDKLMTLNDSRGFSFKKIANWVEKNL